MDSAGTEIYQDCRPTRTRMQKARHLAVTGYLAGRYFELIFSVSEYFALMFALPA
jgi:hypothetical protein